MIDVVAIDEHKVHLIIVFLKWANRGLFFIYFCLFKHTLQFLQQINVKKCPSSIWCRESISQHLEHEYPPITTRPGLPPNHVNLKTSHTYSDASPTMSVPWYLVRANTFCNIDPRKIFFLILPMFCFH